MDSVVPGVSCLALIGNLYVCAANSNCVLRYGGATGIFIDQFVPPDLGGLDQPIALTFGPDENLYVTSAKNDRVLRYDGSTGEFIDVFVEPGSGGLARPSDLAFGRTDASTSPETQVISNVTTAGQVNS